MRSCRRSIAAAVVLVVSLLAAPKSHAADAGVTLTQSAGRAVLANGLVTATIDTASARIVSMKFRGNEMVRSSGKKQHVYFSMAGPYEQPANCVFSVTRQDAEITDVSCKRVFNPALAAKQHAVDIDIHYVMRRGIAGVYAYAILDHPANYPALTIGEWRMVWWVPGTNLLERICVDELRDWEMPEADARFEITGIKEIAKYNSGKWAGRYDCKYAYTADLWALDAYGHTSEKNNLGAWIVCPAHEFFNDGPMKNDLNAAADINHIYLNADHYNASTINIRAGEAWRKIYGPWLLFMTGSKGAKANWDEAKMQAARERAQWPYQWIADPDYAATTRGSVSGRLVVRDSLKPKLTAKGAWVGLAAPEKTAGHWQFQGRDYQYWVRAGEDGSFQIPAVRPGSYTLYAFVTGAVGEFSQEGVIVKKSAPTPLGEVTWNVPHKGTRLAWEIGIPDRTSAEFRHGRTDYWTPYLFEKFEKEFPNPLEYDTARGDWATALNYAQTTFGTGDRRTPWKWRIRFSLDKPPAEDPTLTIAFASSSDTNLDITANDDAKPFASFEPPVTGGKSGGNALLREANHAKYGVSYVKIPHAKLKVGPNTITLSLSHAHWSGSHVMYDYMSLELP